MFFIDKNLNSLIIFIYITEVYAMDSLIFLKQIQISTNRFVVLTKNTEKCNRWTQKNSVIIIDHNKQFVSI